ncbi:MAG: 2-C-methyl-D-erythritol 2,4-cyclodiphosphate synthase [Bacteroidota bacterium]
MTGFRIGFGYDVHQLGEGHKLVIGGIEVPHSRGSIGHSDGDVLIHAICDAMLGALNLRDIGFHFPDTKAELKGIDSKIILKKTIQLIREKGYDIGNIDTTICLQKPRLLSHIPLMQEALAKVMEISQQKIAIKATTTERLGFVGVEQGISAYAVVLLHEK